LDFFSLTSNSSVLRSGERDLVFIDLGEGRFEPREVNLGIRGEGEEVQVKEGVNPGEQVVTQAQFMMDSESRVQEAIAKFMQRGTKSAPAESKTDTKPDAPAASGHNHGG
jgi:Cu(I)/Ag(I) efflux system membrane fusion protein/cobalt-zinc-cadmium efflux system membrane fusion protein